MWPGGRVNGYLNRKLQMLRLSQLLDAQTINVYCQIMRKMPGTEDDRVKLVEFLLTAKEVAPADTSGAICAYGKKLLAWRSSCLSSCLQSAPSNSQM